MSIWTLGLRLDQPKYSTAKLVGYSVWGSLLQWIDSCLFCRSLVVRCDCGYSQPFQILSGVPQGSHLGPLLFKLFTNDMSIVIITNFLPFADDNFVRVDSKRSEEEVQNAINSFVRERSVNAMDLNVSKCLVFTFKL